MSRAATRLAGVELYFDDLPRVKAFYLDVLDLFYQGYCACTWSASASRSLPARSRGPELSGSIRVPHDDSES
jgi:hypothetical protein